MPAPDPTGAEGTIGGGAGANLGLMLQAARNAKGLTLDELSAELRIEPRLLAALEECRFADLGPPVFAKGYLKQYGNRLGLDYRDLLAEYYRLVEPQEISIEPSRTIKLRDERQITFWIVGGLTIALLAVFLFVWVVDEPVSSGPDSIVPAGPQPDLSPIESEADFALPDGDPAPAGDAAAGEEPGAGEAADRAPPEPADAAVAAEGSGPAQGAEPPLGPTIRLEVAFTDDCWTEIVDARGTRLFYGIGRTGTTASFTAEVPVEVVLGNVDGVELTVDGGVFDVPTRSRQGNLARFTLDGFLD